MATKPSRSDFILKLHDLLENPVDPDNLRWTGDLTFEITSHDRSARHALSGKWEFNSLSSFIRQLSYYNFKRLSDRRRSNDRRLSQSGYIVFSHPSGFFRRGDNTELNRIVRKSRNRPDKSGNRRVSSSSMVSNGSYEDDAPPMPTWPPSQHAYAHYSYPDDRRGSQYALGVHHQQQPTYHMGSPGTRPEDDPSWKSPFSAVKWSSHDADSNRNDPRYRMSLPSPRRLEGGGVGPRNHAGLSIQTGTISGDKIAPYPTPSFQSPSYGTISLPDVVPSGLPAPYVEPSSYTYSQHPARETSLPSPSDSEDHDQLASTIDSPPCVSSKLPPIHHHEVRAGSTGPLRKQSIVSPKSQTFYANSQPNANWNYHPLPSPTEPKSFEYSQHHDAPRRAEFFESGGAQRDHYRS